MGTVVALDEYRERRDPAVRAMIRLDRAVTRLDPLVRERDGRLTPTIERELLAIADAVAAGLPRQAADRAARRPARERIATHTSTAATAATPTVAAAIPGLGGTADAIRDRSRTGLRKSRTSHSRSSAIRRSSLSGFTGTGCPTASSIGRSV